METKNLLKSLKRRFSWMLCLVMFLMASQSAMAYYNIRGAMNNWECWEMNSNNQYLVYSTGTSFEFKISDGCSWTTAYSTGSSVGATPSGTQLNTGKGNSTWTPSNGSIYGWTFDNNHKLYISKIALQMYDLGKKDETKYVGDKVSSSDYYVYYKICFSAFGGAKVCFFQNASSVTNITADWNKDDGNNREYKANIKDCQFTSSGKWYVKGAVAAQNDNAKFAYTNNSSASDADGTTTLSANTNGAVYWEVSDLPNATSQSATAASSSKINLSWTRNSTKTTVMVVRYQGASPSVTAPTDGTSYSVNNKIGNGTVIYKGTDQTFSDTGLSDNTTYTYYFYTVNNNYYSSGVSASATTPKACTAPTKDGYTLSSTSFTYSGSGQGPTVSPKTGYGTPTTTKYGTSASGASTTKPTDVGTYHVYITGSASGSYCAYTDLDLGTFTISCAAPTSAGYTLSSTSFTYSGSAQGPTVSPKTGYGSPTTTKYGTSASSATTTKPTNVGTYHVYVTGAASGNYCAYTDLDLGTFAITCPSVATPTFSGYSAAVCKGTTVNLTASVSTGAVGTCTYNWSNPADWTNVSKNGNIFSANANSTGNVTLTVTNGCGTTSSQGTQAVTVKALNSLTSVSLDPSTIKEGETSTATATDAVISEGASDVWTSSDTDVATVVESTGVVTGVKEGTANIIYTISGGCGPIVSQSAQISVIPNCDTPEPGSIDGTLAVCSGSGTTLTLKNHETTNTTIEWYKNDAPTGTATNPYLTGNLSTPATYKVRVSRVGVANCYAETPTVTVTVTAIPTITAQGDSRCGDGKVTLQATATPIGCTVNWYDAATGGTKQGTGLGKEVNVTVGSPVTLYAEAVTTGAAACKSTSRASATATAKLVPSIASVTKTADACGAGDIKFTANGVTASSEVEWFENSVSVGTGGSKTFSGVPAGTSHTVTAKATLNGCESAETTPVTGTRKAVPSLTVTAPSAAYGWENATFTVTGDGTITGSVTQTAGSGGIINDKTFKGHVNDTFRASYTATGDNGCTTQKSAEVTVEKATEVCSK